MLAGTRFDAGKTVVSVFIAGERDDTLVEQTTGGEAQSTAEPAEDAAPPAESEG